MKAIPSLAILGVTVLLSVAVAGVASGDAGPTVEAKRAPLSSLFPMSEAFEFAPPPPGSYKLPVIKPAPDGQVLDVEGRERTLRQLTRGKITLVSFVYLNCSDQDGCPLAISTLFDIHAASARVPELRNEVQLLTISFDPSRDTVEAIAAFSYPILADPASKQKLEWHVLTAPDLDELQPILDGYGQVVDRSNDQEVIKHLLRMYLVDREGRIRNIYGLGLIDPRLLMTDVETLLIEEGRM